MKFSINPWFIVGFAIGNLLFVLLVTLASCATTNDSPPPLEHCDAYMTRKIDGLKRLGTMPVESGTSVLDTGVVLWVQLVNINEKKIYMEALVDTTGALKTVNEAGLKATGSCNRGGKTWQTASGSVGVLKGREADGTN